MFDPNEKLVFDGIVNRLGADDPGFLRRLDRIGRPRRRLRMILASLLWTVAPVCIVLGGWTGLILAVVAVGYGLRLQARRGGTGAQVAWWSSSNRRPGAEI